jgi:hypothetical protein
MLTDVRRALLADQGRGVHGGPEQPAEWRRGAQPLPCRRARSGAAAPCDCLPDLPEARHSMQSAGAVLRARGEQQGARHVPKAGASQVLELVRTDAARAGMHSPAQVRTRRRVPCSRPRRDVARRRLAGPCRRRARRARAGMGVLRRGVPAEPARGALPEPGRRRLPRAPAAEP